MTSDKKLGKKPARKDAVKLKLARYLDTSVLPKLPKYFGHENLVQGSAWGMLGNDQYGDCVWSGAAHETMLWNGEAGKLVVFNTPGVLSDYSAATGFNPLDPSTDQGTDMQEAASYRRKVGIVDVHGQRHRVAAYLALEPGNLTQLYHALHLFGVVGVGIEFPASAMKQFNAGKPWTVVRGSSIEGGHYIPMVAKRSHLQCVTWGATQGMSAGFYDKYNDETIAYISEEMLTNGKSLEGFDLDQLMADLNKVAAA